VAALVICGGGLLLAFLCVVYLAIKIIEGF